MGGHCVKTPMCRVLSGSVQRDRRRQDKTHKNQPKEEEDLLREAVTEGQATRGGGPEEEATIRCPRGKDC